MLSREKILGHTLPRREVLVPEFNDSLLIQAMRVGAWHSLSTDQEDNLLDIVIASCINEDGSAMFSPEDKDTLRDRLSLASAKVIVEAAQDLNGMSKDAAAALEKNSETGLNGVSSSA